MKRARTSGGKGESLTGGTGDVNPQFFSGVMTQTVADNAITSAFPLPVTRLPKGDKVTIVELLKVYADFPPLLGTNVAETTYNISMFFSTVSFGTGALAWNEPNVFALLQRQQRKAFTAAGTYIDTVNDPVSIDLTDGAGHGILLATDQFFVQLSSTNTATTNSVAFKMLYRFKIVGLLEYIGIVQSQQ